MQRNVPELLGLMEKSAAVGQGSAGEASQERCGAMGEVGDHDPPCPHMAHAARAGLGTGRAGPALVPGAGTLLGCLRGFPQTPSSGAAAAVLPCQMPWHLSMSFVPSLAYASPMIYGRCRAAWLQLSSLSRPLGSVPSLPARGREALGERSDPPAFGPPCIYPCAWPFLSPPSSPGVNEVLSGGGDCWEPSSACALVAARKSIPGIRLGSPVRGEPLKDALCSCSPVPHTLRRGWNLQSWTCAPTACHAAPRPSGRAFPTFYPGRGEQGTAERLPRALLAGQARRV